MSPGYFNHRQYLAESWWDRRRFVSNWWRIYAADPYWVPLYHPRLQQAVEPARNQHLARLRPHFIHLEALPKRERGAFASPGFYAVSIEEPVAAAVILADPRRRDRTAYLALLHCVNDTGTFERLINYAAELLQMQRYRKLIGPTGLSPHLGSGLLQDSWNQLPPLHTPYNPPYLPELANITLKTRSQARLYYLPSPPGPPQPASSPAKLVPLEPARLAADLLPLLQAACPPWLDFAPPDAKEAAFLLRWLEPWPLFGWLAQVDSLPVGFVLLQPDLSARLRRAKGGRNPLWRLWLRRAAARPAGAGRILFGAVLPDWRGQGIGRQLLHQALAAARQQKWHGLSIGPLPAPISAVQFLIHHGAQPQQTYLLYQHEF